MRFSSSFCFFMLLAMVLCGSVGSSCGCVGIWSGVVEHFFAGSANCSRAYVMMRRT